MLLAHGPKFVVTPKNPSILEYITSIEVACQMLNNNEAEELRSDCYRALRHSHPPKPNLRKEEMKALKQLKTDKDCMVLTADKGVAMVVMNRQEYIQKALALLEDTNTYRPKHLQEGTSYMGQCTKVLWDAKYIKKMTP